MCLYIVVPWVYLWSVIMAFPAQTHLLYVLGPVAHSVASPIVDPGVASSIPGQSHTLVKIEHEIFSTVILLLLLIQDGQGLLSATSESMCTMYWLTT